MAELKREAARRGRTMSDLVEIALRNLFRSQKQAVQLWPLPVFHSGGAFVDIADRKRSATLPIEYDRQKRKLALPERVHGQAASD